MPYSWDSDSVCEYWSFCGEVESTDLLTFPDSGRFRGIAFVTFKSEEGYQAALACDGEELEGHTLKVGLPGGWWGGAGRE
jgi:nucleolin